MPGRRLSAEERKKQILRSAIRVFARRSYYGATTRMISEEAGVAEALIYRYFQSKRKLFTAAVEHTSRRLVDELARLVDTHSSEPGKALEAILEYYVELLRRHEDFAKMIFWVSAELDDPEVREVYLPYQEQALARLTKSIEQWQEQGTIRRDVQPRAAAWMVLGTYQVLALMKHSGRLDEVDTAAIVDQARPYIALGDLLLVEQS